MTRLLAYIRARLNPSAQESDIYVPVEPMVRTISFAEAKILAAKELKKAP